MVYSFQASPPILVFVFCFPSRSCSCGIIHKVDLLYFVLRCTKLKLCFSSDVFIFDCFVYYVICTNNIYYLTCHCNDSCKNFYLIEYKYTLSIVLQCPLLNAVTYSHCIILLKSGSVFLFVIHVCQYFILLKYLNVLTMVLHLFSILHPINNNKLCSKQS